MAGRLLWMDALRGFAVLAVVVMHAELAAVSVTGEQLPTVHLVNQVLGPIRMPLLMFLSGILLAPSLRKGARRYLAGKWRHIGWPYLLWSVLNLCQLMVEYRLAGQAFDHGWWLRILYDPPTYLWFLGYLFLYYVVVLPLPAGVRAALCPAALALGAMLPAGEPGHRILWLFGFFLLGDLLGRRLRSWGASDQEWTGLRGALVFAGRNSLVFYTTHMMLVSLGAHLLVGLGLQSAAAVFAGTLVLAGAVGAGLSRSRRRNRWTAALFSWPGAVRTSGRAERPAPAPMISA